MTDRNDGGPAFPNPGLADPSCSFQVDVTGMSLRDWFAGQALAGCLASGDSPEPSEVGLAADFAQASYAFADAMIEARK